MKFRVIFSRNARRNLSEIEDYVAERSGEQRAENFLKAIRRTCLNLDTFPQRGRLAREGIRVVGHGRWTNILFKVEGNEVTILGILYGGRDISQHLGVLPPVEE